MAADQAFGAGLLSDLLPGQTDAAAGEGSGVRVPPGLNAGGAAGAARPPPPGLAVTAGEFVPGYGGLKADAIEFVPSPNKMASPIDPFNPGQARMPTTHGDVGAYGRQSDIAAAAAAAIAQSGNRVPSQHHSWSGQSANWDTSVPDFVPGATRESAASTSSMSLAKAGSVSATGGRPSNWQAHAMYS
jgi:hypothetical protein